MVSQVRSVVIIGSAWPLRGGLSNFNERLAEEFYSDGWDVKIYTFSLQYPSFLFPGKTQYSKEAYNGNVGIRVAINSINPLNWLKIGWELKNLRPDLVIIKFWIPFMAPCFGTISRIVKRNGHSKIITIIDNIIPHEKRPGDKALARYFVNGIDGFVTMSRKVLDDVSVFDTNKPKVFSPHPIYDNFGDAIEKSSAILQLGLNPAFRYILFFGFIRDYKGLDLLLNAFADERFRKLPIKLLVAGEYYTDPKSYMDLVKTLNLSEYVIMSNDFIADSEVYKYFCASDLVVQPYKHATQSGVTQIAYHFNRPMIITDVGGLSEFVPDGKVGYVVQPDAESIANAILKFYQEEKEMEFTRNVIEEKTKYSWGRMIETINELRNQIN